MLSLQCACLQLQTVSKVHSTAPTVLLQLSKTGESFAGGKKIHFAATKLSALAGSCRSSVTDSNLVPFLFLFCFVCLLIFFFFLTYEDLAYLYSANTSKL